MSASHHGDTRTADRVRGPLTGRSPAAKLVGLLAFLVVAASVPAGRASPLAVAGAVAVALAVLALAPARAVVARLAIDTPLVVLAVAYAVFGKPPRTAVLGLSRPGLAVGLTIVAKAAIAIVIVSALVACTTTEEIVAGLRTLRLPGWLCDLVALAARQVEVLAADVRRLRLAAALRRGDAGRTAEARTVVRALGAGFVHGAERAERQQIALDLRGGQRPASTTAGAGNTTDWIIAAVPALIALTARVAL